MYTSHHPCWDAKNRDGLPEELDFDYSAIARIIEDSTPVAAPLKAEPQPEKIDISDFEILDDDDLPKVEPTAETPVETDGIPKALADLMREAGVTEKEIRQTCFDRGHYPVDTPIKNYDPNFINGWIIENWTAVVNYIKNNLR